MAKVKLNDCPNCIESLKSKPVLRPIKGLFSNDSIRRKPTKRKLQMYDIRCPNCGTYQTPYGTKNYVVKFWNKVTGVK